MAANPLLACGLGTTWYDFIHTLSWSSNCEVAQVLSDIPFISVGILVFTLSVFFLVLKRAFLSAVWLFFSAFLAFIASVLDLGHTLANETAASTTFVASEPVVRAREVFFAFSIGFRFLFYWSYVAEPPLKARCMASTQKARRISLLTLERTYEPHSGSWTRRGLPGKLFGASLLIVIIIITALQVVWRVVPQLHQYGNVYAADAVLELLASFLLLLKLLLNTVAPTSPSSMLVHTFKECFAPISGLLVNIAIGVGNLLYFAFTESTVGRLLQALEIYVIVLFVVVVAFLRHRDILLSATSSQVQTRSDVVFTLPEPTRGSTFRVATPIVETPRMSTVLGATIQSRGSSREALRRSARRSLNLVSSWMSSRISRNRPRYEDEAAKLWNAEDGKVNPPYIGNIDTNELQASIVSLMQESKEPEFVHDASANHMSITPTLDAQSANARSMDGVIHTDHTRHPYQANAPRCAILLQDRTSSVPISSFLPSTPPVAMHAVHTGSPVYGLGGIQSLASAPDSRTSLDELLRQQSQLDKSIEALKLFSTRMSTKSSSSNSVLNHKSVELSRSSSIGQKTVSSDVSLSNFPAPPWSTTPVTSLSSPPLPSMKRFRGDRRARFATAAPIPSQGTHDPFSTRSSESLVDTPTSLRLGSIPHSPSGEEIEPVSEKAGRSPSDFGGTGYNVTSFIGGLATPGEPGQGKPWYPTQRASSVGATQTNSGTKLPFRTQGRLEELLAPPTAAKLPPLARSSRLPQGNIVDVPADVVQHQANEETSSLAMTAHSTQILVRGRAGNGIMRETDLPVTASAERADRVQRTFVRPRPPPLALQPYIEQEPGIPRVQVLADD